MTDVKKPDGWCQFILAMDCETTGLCFKSDDPTQKGNEKHQAVSWGFVVADSHTLKPVDELYVEIMWNDDSILQRHKDPKFGRKAEEIHKLTFDHLEEHGKEEPYALKEILELIQKYWGVNNSIRCLGHNVATFDLWFLKSLIRRHNIPDLKFSNRQIDTSSGGFINFEAYTSDQLFEECGMTARDTHDALVDAKMALNSARVMRQIFQMGLDVLTDG